MQRPSPPDTADGLSIARSSIVVRPESPESPAYTARFQIEGSRIAVGRNAFHRCRGFGADPQAATPGGAGRLRCGNRAQFAASAGCRHRRPGRPHPQGSGGPVTHTDVADNNFTTLFQTLTDDPDSYLPHHPATFCSAVGRSFYQQIPRRTASRWAGRPGPSSGCRARRSRRATICCRRAAPPSPCAPPPSGRPRRTGARVHRLPRSRTGARRPPDGPDRGSRRIRRGRDAPLIDTVRPRCRSSSPTADHRRRGRRDGDPDRRPQRRT